MNVYSMVPSHLSHAMAYAASMKTSER